MIKHAYIATILSFQFSKTPPRHLPPPPHQLSTGTSLGISGWMHQSPVISVSGCSEVETHQQTASNPLHIETYRNCFLNWATKKIKNQKPRKHKKTTKRYNALQTSTKTSLALQNVLELLSYWVARRNALCFLRVIQFPHATHRLWLDMVHYLTDNFTDCPGSPWSQVSRCLPFTLKAPWIGQTKHLTLDKLPRCDCGYWRK